MNSFQDYLAHGNAWLYVPAAVVLGALHGMEPGHSKTMMAAFLISIRGTVTQAILLGVSATLSHTAIIWVLAFIGLRFSNQLNVEELEPYFQVGTGIIIVSLAFWMFRRIKREQAAAELYLQPIPAKEDAAPHGGLWVNLGKSWLEISVFEDGVPPHFRLYFYDQNKQPIAAPAAADVSIETLRTGDSRQLFQFQAQADFLQSTSDIPEPHEFTVALSLRQNGQLQTFHTQFAEEHHHHDHDLISGGHGHEHGHSHDHGHSQSHSPEYQDEHEREHARELEQRFANRQVTTGQIILFGLTGGLLPCPSAFAVLLVCLQLKQFALGFAIVLAFSLGLAITLVTVGTVAALSVKHATKKFKGFDGLSRRLPYASAGVMSVIGLLVTIHGVTNLLHHP